MRPIVAIVGRPNVGKSTLFNRMAGERLSIVEDTPGVTRDRLYADADWLNYNFTIIDTGGLDPESTDVISRQMYQQAEVAIETADVIIFLVDIQSGVMEDDIVVANQLRKTKKPVVLVVNKVDGIGQSDPEVYEFYSLGLGDPIPISAGQGLGLGDMLDEVVKYFKDGAGEDEEDNRIKVAIVGKPNVGKSSLINRILNENRLIVSDIPGTTRDAVDTYFERDDREFVFIDTAGIRRKAKIKENIERYSIIRAVAAVERCDVCVLVISAEEGITDQDTKIAGIAHERGKAAIIVVNKWDAVEKDDKTMNKFTKEIEHELKYMPYAPKLFISALTGQRVDKVFDMITAVYENSAMRVATGILNDVLIEAMAMTPPPIDKGKQLKIYFVTQVSVKPPTFVLFVNDVHLMHFSYRRFIENQIRQNFGFKGTPIHFVVRHRKD